MFANLTNLILESIRTHGLVAVIIGVAIETIIVPLPSPLIVMAAGFILIPQGNTSSVIFNAAWISIVAGLAQTIGSYLLYFIGYYGGKPIIDKYEKIHGISWKEIDSFQKKFEGRREDITLFFLRALPIMPLSVISGVAGIMKMKFKKYSIFTFFGVVPRDFFLALLGFYLGSFYMVVANRIDLAETVFTILIILSIVLYILGNKTGIFNKLRSKIL